MGGSATLTNSSTYDEDDDDGGDDKNGGDDDGGRVDDDDDGDDDDGVMMMVMCIVADTFVAVARKPWSIAPACIVGYGASITNSCTHMVTDSESFGARAYRASVALGFLRFSMNV